MFERPDDAARAIAELEAENQRLALRLRELATGSPPSDGAAAVADWARSRARELQPQLELIEREIDADAALIGQLEARLESLRGSRSLSLLRRLLG